MKKHLDDDFYNPHFNTHHISNKHMLVCGLTGAGKTNFLFNLLYQMADTFGKVIIVCKQKSESVYSMLKEHLKEGIDIIDYTELKNLEQMPKQIGQTLIVFDDFCNFKNQDMLEDYAIRARKYKYMCVYLTQSFFLTGKIIRQNVGYLVLLTLSSDRDLKAILNTVNFPYEKDILKQLVRNATSNPMNVCIIDILISDMNKKIRRNFRDFYILEDESGHYINPQLFSGDGMIN